MGPRSAFSSFAFATPTGRQLSSSTGRQFAHGRSPSARRRRGNHFFRPRISSARATVRANVLPESSPSETESQTQTREAFSWTEQWYPVALEEDLSRTEPTAVAILGRCLVVWKSGPAQWSVFNDSCPHRFAALSEGRIDHKTGNLQCGYHGWEFSSSGECAVVPQAANASAAASPLACATSLPTRVSGGILFAWLGASAPPSDSAPPVLSGARARHVVSTFARDLPFSSATLLENVLDPAHIHFAHHRQLGHRALAAPIDIRILPVNAPSSVAFTGEYYAGQVLCLFKPPCLVEITTASGKSFAYYAIPVDANRSRTIGVMAQARPPSLVQRITPRWVDHVRRNALVDGDLPLMYSQEHALTSTHNQPTRPSLYLPTASDRLIVELRKWLAKNALPAGLQPRASEARDRSELLDRYASHTCLCTRTCLPAYRNTRRLKAAAFCAAVVAGALAVLASFGARALPGLAGAAPALYRAAHPAACSALVAVALAATALHGLLRRLERRFVYVEDARRHTHAH